MHETGAGMAGMGPMSGPGWMPTAAPSLARLLAWHPQPVPVFPVLCLLAAVFYGGAVLRLRRRGDAWPPGRVAAFGIGLVCVCAVTGTGIGGYGMELLSAHMIQHGHRVRRVPVAAGRASCCSLSCTHAVRPCSPRRSSPCRC